jgi:peroxiredoxin
MGNRLGLSCCVAVLLSSGLLVTAAGCSGSISENEAPNGLAGVGAGAGGEAGTSDASEAAGSGGGAVSTGGNAQGGQGDSGGNGAGGGASANALCPALGPFGTKLGDVAADVALLDCEGNEHRLHDLCEKSAIWILEYADWCPVCRSHARAAAARYDKFAGNDFGAFMVITEKRDGSAPDAELCAWARDEYGIEFPVLIDTNDAFQDALGVPPNKTQVVFGEGMVIVHKGSESGVEAAIETALGR